jgi:uncharacterized membrane protein YphA (DoxX/SURF4 family)
MAFLNQLGKYKNFGLLILRVGLGVMFIYHGLQKLLGGPYNTLSNYLSKNKIACENNLVRIERKDVFLKPK